MPASAAQTGVAAEMVPSFEFAFNSPNFSDRVLRIEIIAGGDDVGGRSAADCARHHEKNKKDSSSNMLGASILRENPIHINSAILAARSPFFLKLFSNGMKESDQKDPTIRIADKEENALLELLGFMYSGKLTTRDPTLLLDILTAADKFEVLSCMSHCSQLLTSLPMTTEYALLYLEHQRSNSVNAEVQPLIDASKEFLAKKYKDLTNLSRELIDELKHMPLAGIEAIFSSTDIRPLCEDQVYTFFINWAQRQYPESEERQKIWSSHLLPLVRFSHMSWRKLHEILTCSDDGIDHEQRTKCITDALLHKTYPAHKQSALAAEAATCCHSPERAYIYKTLKVVEFDRPHPQVIVYLDLTREECSRLYPIGEISSDYFYLAGCELYLNATCEMDEQSKSCHFGLWFGIGEEPEVATCLTLYFEFSIRRSRPGYFSRKWRDTVIFTSASMEGLYDLFGVEWKKFIADDNLFINGVLHLKVDLTVVEQPELRT